MLLDTLMPYLMPDDSAGGGAAGGEGNDGAPANLAEGDGQQGGAAATGTQSAGTQAPSANKLIKDFVAEHGMTVEELLSDYTSLKDATKTESERLTGERDRFKGEADQLRTELRNLRSESAFLEAAREARARAPKTLFRAFRDQLDYDKAGNPTNIADVIAAARDEEPDLFLAATGTSDAGRRGDGDGEAKNINDAIRELIQNSPR